MTSKAPNQKIQRSNLLLVLRTILEKDLIRIRRQNAFIKERLRLDSDLPYSLHELFPVCLGVTSLLKVKRTRGNLLWHNLIIMINHRAQLNLQSIFRKYIRPHLLLPQSKSQSCFRVSIVIRLFSFYFHCDIENYFYRPKRLNFQGSCKFWPSLYGFIDLVNFPKKMRILYAGSSIFETQTSIIVQLFELLDAFFHK